jgi:hypothetical protein
VEPWKAEGVTQRMIKKLRKLHIHLLSYGRSIFSLSFTKFKKSTLKEGAHSKKSLFHFGHIPKRPRFNMRYPVGRNILMLEEEAWK